MWTQKEKEILQKLGFKLNTKGEMVRKTKSDPLTSIAKGSTFRATICNTIRKTKTGYNCLAEDYSVDIGASYEAEEDSFDFLDEAIEFFN